jgi:hypothetical protein
LPQAKHVRRDSFEGSGRTLMGAPAAHGNTQVGLIMQALVVQWWNM